MDCTQKMVTGQLIRITASATPDAVRFTHPRVQTVATIYRPNGLVEPFLASSVLEMSLQITRHACTTAT